MHFLHIPLCVVVILLQIRHSLAVGFLVNLAVAVEGFAAFLVTGESTDEVRILDFVVLKNLIELSLRGFFVFRP